MVGAFQVMRRVGALLLVLTWALAFLVIPGVHGAFHQNDHHHLANGAVVPEAPAHPHPHPHPQKAPEEPTPAPAPGPLDHGAGLAHFGGAISSPKPQLQLTPALGVVLREAKAITERPSQAPRLRQHRARGPPPQRLG
ncbi:MAG: hypothetical protein IPG45_02690 [Deltaproteobacteria bacterium]|nr:hypothetical protein [Deltaproteobacteria bacterium]